MHKSECSFQHRYLGKLQNEKYTYSFYAKVYDEETWGKICQQKFIWKIYIQSPIMEWHGMEWHTENTRMSLFLFKKNMYELYEFINY